jgi:hypothetical protein
MAGRDGWTVGPCLETGSVAARGADACRLGFGFAAGLREAAGGGAAGPVAVDFSACAADPTRPACRARAFGRDFGLAGLLVPECRGRELGAPRVAPVDGRRLSTEVFEPRQSEASGRASAVEAAQPTMSTASIERLRRLGRSGIGSWKACRAARVASRAMRIRLSVGVMSGSARRALSAASASTSASSGVR